MLDSLEEWLQIDSTTGREAEFLEFLEDRLTALGLETRRQHVAEADPDAGPTARWNLVAEASRNPSLWFSTHVDCVPPHLPVRREGDTLYGRGACDTKGGLFAMLRAAERLLEDGVDDFGFLLVVGEEVDHRGAKQARQLDLQADRLILCEPTRNRVVSGQKGMVKVELSSEGRAGHSAFPDEGVSAIARLLDALQALRSSRWPEDELLGETTLNVGVLEGGVAANVFAPSARAELVFRTFSSSGALLDKIEALCGNNARVEPVTYNDPVEFEPPGGFETCVVPFNTDATYLSELAPVWLVGPGDIRLAHSEREHIDAASLREGVDLYVRLARLALDV